MSVQYTLSQCMGISNQTSSSSSLRLMLMVPKTPVDKQRKVCSE